MYFLFISEKLPSLVYPLLILSNTLELRIIKILGKLYILKTEFDKD